MERMGERVLLARRPRVYAFAEMENGEEMAAALNNSDAIVFFLFLSFIIIFKTGNFIRSFSK